MLFSARVSMGVHILASIVVGLVFMLESVLHSLIIGVWIYPLKVTARALCLFVSAVQTQVVTWA